MFTCSIDKRRITRFSPSHWLGSNSIIARKIIPFSNIVCYTEFNQSAQRIETAPPTCGNFEGHIKIRSVIFARRFVHKERGSRDLFCAWFLLKKLGKGISVLWLFSNVWKCILGREVWIKLHKDELPPLITAMAVIQTKVSERKTHFIGYLLPCERKSVCINIVLGMDIFRHIFLLSCIENPWLPRGYTSLTRGHETFEVQHCQTLHYSDGQLLTNRRKKPKISLKTV
jgi:hypothetical protein